MNSELTLKRLKEVLYYHPEQGVFYWLVGGHGRYPGNVAGCGSKRYSHIRVDNKNYLQHRLAFFYMTGRWPGQVDHINRDKSDNRWSNLRECTPSENQANRVYPCRKNGLPMGVDYEQRNRRYRGFFRVEGRLYKTKWFKTADEAAGARLELRQSMGMGTEMVQPL